MFDHLKLDYHLIVSDGHSSGWVDVLLYRANGSERFRKDQAEIRRELGGQMSASLLGDSIVGLLGFHGWEMFSAQYNLQINKYIMYFRRSIDIQEGSNYMTIDQPRLKFIEDYYEQLAAEHRADHRIGRADVQHSQSPPSRKGRPWWDRWGA